MHMKNSIERVYITVAFSQRKENIKVSTSMVIQRNPGCMHKGWKINCRVRSFDLYFETILLVPLLFFDNDIYLASPQNGPCFFQWGGGGGGLFREIFHILYKISLLSGVSISFITIDKKYLRGISKNPRTAFEVCCFITKKELGQYMQLSGANSALAK